MPQTLEEIRQGPGAHAIGTAAGGATTKEDSFLLKSGVLHQIVDGQSVVVAIRKAGAGEGIFQKHARITAGLVPVRDASRAVLRAQMENLPYAAL